MYKFQRIILSSILECTINKYLYLQNHQVRNPHRATSSLSPTINFDRQHGVSRNIKFVIRPIKELERNYTCEFFLWLKSNNIQPRIFL